MRTLAAAVAGFVCGVVLATNVASAATPQEDAVGEINAAIALLEKAKVKLQQPAPTPSVPVRSRIFSIWHHRWAGPPLRTYPLAVESAVNMHVLGIAQSAGSGTGSIEYAPANGESVAEHVADIRALRAAGDHVLLGIGGSQDGGITLTAAAHADQMAASINTIIERYGISGIDLDLEDPARWNESAMMRLVDLLKARHGNSFQIGMTAALYGDRTAKWLAAARACATRCAYLSVMLYDFPEAGGSGLTAVAVNKADVMRAGGIPAEKIVLGFMPRPTASYANATPSAQLAVDAWNAVKARYPTAGGVFIWEDKILAARGWDFVDPLARALNQ